MSTITGRKVLHAISAKNRGVVVEVGEKVDLVDHKDNLCGSAIVKSITHLSKWIDEIELVVDPPIPNGPIFTLYGIPRL